MRTMAMLSLALALMLSACTQKHDVPAAPSNAGSSVVEHSAPPSPLSEEAFDGFVASEDPRLHDRFIDAENLAFDEADLPAGEEDEYLFGENFPNTPVQFELESSTNLRVSAEQQDFEQAMLRHNASLTDAANDQEEQPSTAQTPEASADNNGPKKSSEAAIAAPTSTGSEEAKNKKPAIVDEKSILADPHGQWAVSAKASSSYAQSSDEKAGYAAWQATGAPNVPRYSDSPASWTTKSGDNKDPEWLELKYANPVHASAVRARQSAAPGVISRLELIDTNGQAHEIWSGTDDTAYEKNAIGWFIREFPATEYLVAGVRLTLMTARVWGWNEIDAVQLVGEP